MADPALKPALADESNTDAPARVDEYRRPGVRRGGVRLPARLLLAVFTLAGFAVVAAWGIGELRGEPANHLTRDPLTVATSQTGVEFPGYIGLLSNLGVLMWAVAAGAALLGALVLSVRESEPAGFLGGAAGLTAILLADDLFQGHESLPSRGPSELAYFATLAAVLAVLLYRFRALVLRRTVVPLLAAAGALFAMSLAVDQGLTLPGGIFLEDTLKFFGIVAWSTWLVAASTTLLAGALVAAARAPRREPAVRRFRRD